MKDSQGDATSSTALSVLDQDAKLVADQKEIAVKYLAEMEEQAARNDAFLGRIRRPYAEYKKAHPRGKLCQRCAGINWSLLLPSENSHYCDGSGSSELFGVPESSRELSTASCPLCLLMGSGQNFDKIPNRRLDLDCACYKLRKLAGHSEVPHHKRDWKHHAPRLRLSHNGDTYILQNTRSATQGYVLRPLTPERIDYQIPRSWLKHCKRHHTTNCSSTFASFIPGLKVFDCNASKVVHAPEDTDFCYIALSYVWGGVQISEKEQAGFPATICDAIIVTLKLGYRYLWIDQLCIHQSDETYKKAQIRLMGRIYAEADLVIIAAAGDSSHYGLPGVSIKPRQAQARVELETNVELIRNIDVYSGVINSAWATRGWTHRRAIWPRESTRWPTMRSDKHPLQVLPQIFPTSSASHADVFQIISNYSERKLSFEGDILNACIGILEKLVDLHFWGIVAVRPDSTPRCFLALKWYNRNPGQRREGFPTWSWAATTGPKRTPYPSGHYVENCVAEILTTDGSWLTLENQTESRYDTLPKDHGPTLRLTGTFYTASLRMIQNSGKLQEHEENSEQRRSVIFQHAGVDGDDIEIAFKLWLDAKISDCASQNTVKAVQLQGIPILGGVLIPRMLPKFMILQAVGDHYSRIGFAGGFCRIREKKTGLIREKDGSTRTLHPDCIGDEETIYII